MRKEGMFHKVVGSITGEVFGESNEQHIENVEIDTDKRSVHFSV